MLYSVPYSILNLVLYYTIEPRAPHTLRGWLAWSAGWGCSCFNFVLWGCHKIFSPSSSSLFSSSASFFFIYPTFSSEIHSQNLHILGISLAYLWHIFGISLVYIWYIFGISLAYLWHIFGICLANLCFRLMSWINFWHILGISFSYLWQLNDCFT